MAPGKEEPRHAEDTDLKHAIAIGLDEAMTALEEAFYDLTDEQVASFPLPDRHNITTMVMHCLKNLDEYGLHCQTGESVIAYEERFDMWSHPPQELHPLQKDLPTVREMVARLHALRDAIVEALDAATEEDLRRPRDVTDWYAQWGRVSADAYMRTIMHTMAHVRQIWMLRGVMGLTDRDGWPVQHWA